MAGLGCGMTGLCHGTAGLCHGMSEPCCGIASLCPGVDGLCRGMAGLCRGMTELCCGIAVLCHGMVRVALWDGNCDGIAWGTDREAWGAGRALHVGTDRRQGARLSEVGRMGRQHCEEGQRDRMERCMGGQTGGMRQLSQRTVDVDRQRE